MSSVKQVSDGDFEAEVLNSKTPVLIDFFAEWCGPCKMMAPVLDEVARDYAGQLKVVKVDVDESQDVAAKYRIQSIPTLMVFKGGQEVDRVVGAVPKPMLLQRVKKHL